MSESPPGHDGWAELGEMLQDRRGELDPRYTNRRLFTDEQGVNYRVIWDIEHGRRANFKRPMLTAIEVAYGLARGSIRRFLAGGDLEALPGTPPVKPSGRRGSVTDLRPGVVRAYWDHPVIGRFVRRMWELDIPQAQKLTLIEEWAATLSDNGSGSPSAGRP